MNELNYWQKRAGRRFGRRKLIVGGGFGTLGLAAMATVGCGGDDGEDDAGPGDPTQQGASPTQSTTPTQSAVKRGGTLTMARTGNLAFTDPHRSSGGLDPIVTRLYAECLVRYDGDEVKAYMASALEQPDPATVTLRLRNDIKFADGTPLNAEAVKYSIERGKDATLNAPVRPTFSLVDRVETPDEFTAILKLVRPNAIFLPSWAYYSSVVSPTALEQAGPDNFNKKPISAGPYKVDRIVQDGESVFTKDPEWPLKAPDGGALPYFDRVVNRIIPQPEALVAALLAGDVDLVNSIDLASVKQVQGSGGVVAFEVPSAAWQATVEFVTNKPPTDNLALRKAINYALNRDELNKQLAFGLAKPAVQCLTLDSWLLDPSLPNYEFDLKKSADALSQAGYPDGIDLKLATYNSAQAEAIQAQLARANVRATVEQLELAVYQDRFRTKGEIPIGTAGGPTEGGELYQFFLTRMGSKGKYNPGQPTNPEWDALIAKVESAFDREDRKKLYQEMLRKSYDESSRAWTLTTPVFYGLSDKVQGVTPMRENRTNPDLRFVWKA